MARKTNAKLDQSPVDQVAIEAIRGIAVQLGRAISISCIAAMVKPNSLIEDDAIKAMDAAWTELADKIIDFGMKGLT